MLWPLLIWEKKLRQQSELQQHPSAVLPLLPGGDRGPSRVSARFGASRRPQSRLGQEVPHGRPRVSRWAGRAAGREQAFGADENRGTGTLAAARMREEGPGWRNAPAAHASERTAAVRGTSRGSAEQGRTEQSRRPAKRQSWMEQRQRWDTVLLGLAADGPTDAGGRQQSPGWQEGEQLPGTCAHSSPQQATTGSGIPVSSFSPYWSHHHGMCKTLQAWGEGWFHTPPSPAVVFPKHPRRQTQLGMRPGLPWGHRVATVTCTWAPLSVLERRGAASTHPAREVPAAKLGQ